MTQETTRRKTAAQNSKSEASAKLVKMVRGEKTADVHPDEVENYKRGNWVIES